MPGQEKDDGGKEGSRKRRLRTGDLRGLVRSVRDGRFHYEGRPNRSLDWSSYNEAQVNEIADTLNLIRRFVDMASRRMRERPKGRGRPPYPPSDVAKALLMQSYFGVSDRVAEGLVRLFKEKLGISTEFSYKTIERGYDPGPVTEVLQEVFRLTNEYGNAKEDTFSVDGSGDPTSSKVNYESVRSEQRRGKEEGAAGGAGEWPARHDFQYTVSSVGAHTKVVGGFMTTGDHSLGELSLLPSVLSQTHGNCHSMENVLGDSLYANRQVCRLIASYGAKPFLFPRTNSTFMSHGVPSWSEMLYSLVSDPQEWFREYHMRSISETSNSMDKTKFPFRIRRKIPQRKCAAESLRIYVHNVRRYSYMRYVQPELIVQLRN